MTPARRFPPEHVPVLSAGKHRSARKGACFMEFASYLAGERWSDHPDCTHPLLATLARGVNDHLSDEARQRLAPLVPAVIGLTSEDPQVDVHIALRCARTALPIVAAEQQRVMAVGVLACKHVLAHLDPDGAARREGEFQAVLQQAPHAARWAHAFAEDLSPSVGAFRRIAAPSIVRGAVSGIAAGRVADPDAVLHRLLVDAIDICSRWVAAPVGHAGAVNDASTTSA